MTRSHPSSLGAALGASLRGIAVRTLTAWAAIVLAQGAWSPVRAQAGSPAGEMISGFRVEIEGRELAGVESITMEDLVIDARDTGLQDAGGWRVYGPGDPHYGTITIRVRACSGERSELYQWWSDASVGRNVRKNISVIALKRDGSEARRWNLYDCYPLTWDPGEFSPSSAVACETIVAKMQRVELGLAGGSDDDCDSPPGELPAARLRGVQRLANPPDASCTVARVEVSLVSDDGTEKKICTFTSVRGGAAGIAWVESDSGKVIGRIEPGYKYVDTLVLRGPLTSGRKSIAQWISETVSGSPSRRTVVIKEILKDGSTGKTYTYHDCFPTRYVFPAFSASGTGNLYEEVQIKPIRLE